MTSISISVRSLVLILLAGAVSACATEQKPSVHASLPAPPSPSELALATSSDPAKMYSEAFDQGFHVPAVGSKMLASNHHRQVVDYSTSEAPGTVVVDQTDRFLYFVMPDSKAMRYTVAVGPASRNFTGTAMIDRKAKWPRWTPTQSMIQRSPDHYGRFKDGVDGGPSNPMGARALYIQKDGIDTYYRVHGTNDPSSIGKAVSAGCIRLLNQDVMDLYERVRVGARIVVL